MDLDELLREYAENFNSAFPVYAFPGDEDEMAKVIEECLENDTEYEPEYDNESDY